MTEQSAFNLNAQDVLPELSDFPLEPGETFMPIGVPIRKFENIESAWHIAESARLPVPTDGPTSTQPQVESQVEAEEENAIESAPKVEKALEPAIIESAPLTRNIITDNWRKFSLDLAPKVRYYLLPFSSLSEMSQSFLQMLLSRGSFIELLISSGVSRYAEFKLVNRILTRKSDDQTFEVVSFSLFSIDFTSINRFFFRYPARGQMSSKIRIFQ